MNAIRSIRQYSALGRRCTQTELMAMRVPFRYSTGHSLTSNNSRRMTKDDSVVWLSYRICFFAMNVIQWQTDIFCNNKGNFCRFHSRDNNKGLLPACISCYSVQLLKWMTLSLFHILLRIRRPVEFLIP